MIGFLLILLVALVLTDLCAQAQNREAQIPGMPKNPPPLIVYQKGSTPPENASTIKLTAGWQIVFFPVKKVSSVWGLRRMLYKFNDNFYVAVDPVNNPQALEPGIAYITFSDAPSIVYFKSSSPAGVDVRTSLSKGWNMIGFPALKDSGSTLVTLTNQSGQSIVPTDLQERSSWPSKTWISPNTATFINGQWQITSQSLVNSLKPGRILAVYCREPLTLNWNTDPSTAVIPQVSQVVPNDPSPGSTVFVKGSNLGKPGTVSVAGMPIPSSSITDWRPNYIKFKMPLGVPSGSLRVIVDGYPSVASSVAISPLKATVAQNNVPAAAVPAAPATAASITAPKQPVAKPISSNSLDARIADVETDIANLNSANSVALNSKTADLKPTAPEEAINETDNYNQYEGYNTQHREITSRLSGQPQSTSSLLDNVGLGGLGRASGNSSIVGVVTTGRTHPLSGAKVTLGNGQRTTTNSSGEFAFHNVPASNNMRVSVSKSGYKNGSGSVAVAPGATKSIRVNLSPSSVNPSDSKVAKKGNFTVRAESMRKGPKDRRLYVYKIEVTQEGNLSKHWQNTWWDDNGDSYVELRCDNAELDANYNIEVTWKGGPKRQRVVSGKWTKKVISEDQTLTFSNP